MPRQLDTATLDAAARFYAAEYLREDVPHPRRPGRFLGGRGRVLQDLFDATYMDEHDHLVAALREELGSRARGRFDADAKARFTPRDPALFADLLAEKLAVTPDGEHIEGRVGTVVRHGMRLVGEHMVEVETPESLKRRKRLRALGMDPGPRLVMQKVVPLYWPIYAGEQEERTRPGGGAADPLPDGTPGLAVGATNTRISNECAILACDAIVDNLDEGTGAAVICGYTGAQPADPDTPASGTKLFTLVCSDPAFGGASDADPGATATASSITDDSSADDTGTLGYCRASSTNDGATPLDDHLDGEAGTSGADFNFNTVSIVAGATVSLSSWTVTMPES